MPEFDPIPKVPQTDITPWMYEVLTSIVENVELLTGVRVTGVRAVTNDTVRVVPNAFQNLKRITADGSGYTSGGGGALPPGVSVPSLEDHVKLAQDVQAVINDMARIESALNELLAQLRS